MALVQTVIGHFIALDRLFMLYNVQDWSRKVEVENLSIINPSTSLYCMQTICHSVEVYE